ncbi:hypothetical protein CYMTET_45207 [Cymbomonas tetramitiformis]|uniref:Uncharacterized protein n=1 Tax=Cymbomonas tetramitiformis TaxID=36881 RepID=A0AAE0EY93_9CHLO|nr:hypothetical protein CYMTET_45207 [Cymbomonas tetramitiformis]
MEAEEMHRADKLPNQQQIADRERAKEEHLLLQMMQQQPHTQTRQDGEEMVILEQMWEHQEEAYGNPAAPSTKPRRAGHANREETSGPVEREKYETRTTKKRKGPAPSPGRMSEGRINASLQRLKGDEPLHKLSNEFWKRGTFAERRTILKWPKDGKDTVPSYVDMVLIEGMEGMKDGEELTQKDAPKKVTTLHLIEIAHTDDEKWGGKLLEKHVKYTSLKRLLEGHRFKTKLHVMVLGRTGTVYRHTKQILEQLGLNKMEAIMALKKIHGLTVTYANSMYQLYRELRRGQKEQEEENHPT